MICNQKYHYKMRLLAFILFFMSAIQPLQAKQRKVAVLLGGGRGQYDDVAPQIANQAKAMVNTLGEYNYEFYSSFGGSDINDHISNDHDFDIKDRKVRERFFKGLTPSSEENFNALIANLENQVRTGKINSGDQVVIQISTHGAQKNKSEKSHSVSLPSSLNDQNENVPQNFSLDKLMPLLRMLNRKGVKVALLDFSCFSGNSLALALKNVCVVSASNRYTPGTVADYASAGTNFWDKMNANQMPTIEDAFLDIRKEATNALQYQVDKMEISTPEHLRIRNIIDPIFAETYAFSPGKNTSRKDAIKPILKCARNVNSNDIRLFDQLTTDLIQFSFDQKKLKQYAQILKQYAKLIDQAEKIETRPVGYYANRAIRLPSCFGYYSDQTFTLNDKSNHESLEGYRKRFKEALESEKETLQEELNRETYRYNVCSTEKVQADIKKYRPDHLKIYNSGIKMREQLKDLARTIGPKETEIYNTLYTELKKDTVNSSHPCRDFKF